MDILLLYPEFSIELPPAKHTPLYLERLCRCRRVTKWTMSLVTCDHISKVTSMQLGRRSWVLAFPIVWIFPYFKVKQLFFSDDIINLFLLRWFPFLFLMSLLLFFDDWNWTQGPYIAENDPFGSLRVVSQVSSSLINFGCLIRLHLTTYISPFEWTLSQWVLCRLTFYENWQNLYKIMNLDMSIIIFDFFWWIWLKIKR